MDVDLIRPGTVPLNPNTILYFEFLLNPDLLEIHLKKSNPDPSAVDLLTKFMNTIFESTKNDQKYFDDNFIRSETGEFQFKELKRVLALRILSLKVFAFLNWDLDFLIKKVPVKFHLILFQDLLYFCTEKFPKFEIPLSAIVSQNLNENISNQTQFALVLYHRWIVKLFVFRSIQIRYSKGFAFFTSHQYEGAYLQNLNDEALKLTFETAQASVDYLKQINETLKMPKLIGYECLEVLRESSVKFNHNWSQMIEIDRNEFQAQINFDLGTFFFQQKKIAEARHYFHLCASLMTDTTKSSNYLSFTKDALDGYLNACDVSVNDCGSQSKSLTQKFLYYVYVQTNCEQSLIEILIDDNKCKEIPMVYRTTYELDLQSALAYNLVDGKNDHLIQVQVLNMIRNVLERNSVMTSNFKDLLCDNKSVALNSLKNALDSLLDYELSSFERDSLNSFLNNIIYDLGPANKLVTELLAINTVKHFYSPIEDNSSKLVDNLISAIDLNNLNWNSFGFFEEEPLLIQEKLLLSVEFEQDIANIEKLQSVDSNDIFNSNDKPFVSIWKNGYEANLPACLKNVLQQLPTSQSNVREFTNFFLMKSSRFLTNKNYTKAKEALEFVLKLTKSNENQSQFKKLNQLLEWEVLFIEMSDFLENWNVATANQKKNLCKKCKNCIKILRMEDFSLRPEIAELCLTTLLNLGEWDFICSLDRIRTLFEMITTFSGVCIEFALFKSNKKIYKDFWELIVPVFHQPSSSSKRSQNSSRDPQITTRFKNNLLEFIMKIRDITCFNIMLSLFARTYNILRDDTNYEINNEYLHIWPAVISNANSYNLQEVAEFLECIIKQSLCYYPQRIQFIKLAADLAYVKNESRLAIRYYLLLLMFSTDYFQQPITKLLVDDYIVKRMIKCCLQLNSFVQVTILCQFLDDIDYALAFKSLNDSKTNVCADATDELYQFIWNNTILEYVINLHHKRGEEEKKQKALKLIGQLELNANNNEEIRNEAANIRKQNFLRHLARQYIFSDEEPFFDSEMVRFEPILNGTLLHPIKSEFDSSAS